MKSFFKINLCCFPLLIFIILSVFLWRGLHEDPHALSSTLINKPLPVFAMSSLTQSHFKMTEKNFLGQVTLLNVFATWCLSCHSEHPVLMDIAHSGEIIVYGLDYKDDSMAATAWLAKYGNPYREIINDSKGDFAINLGVYGTPETFIIDRRGIIRDKYTGPITMEVWQKILLPKIKRLQKI